MTNNVLLRVRLIQVGDDFGSGFTIDVDGRQYLITAKHVVASLTGPKGMISICKRVGDCSAIEVTVLRCADPIDIAVLIPSNQLTVNFPLEPQTAGLFFAQDVYFLGFPFGSRFSTRMPTAAYPLPFVKKAIVSAQVEENGARKIFLDGHNNFGFSGGPIVYRDLNQGGVVFKVAAVVSGFQPELTDVLKPEKIESEQITDDDRARGTIVDQPDGTHLKLKPTGDVVQLNTGIVVGFPIDYAVDLIRKSPTGPLVSDKFTP